MAKYDLMVPHKWLELTDQMSVLISIRMWWHYDNTDFNELWTCFKLTPSVGDVGTGSEDVHLEQNLVHNFINKGTTFYFCTMKLSVFFLKGN